MMSGPWTTFPSSTSSMQTTPIGSATGEIGGSRPSSGLSRNLKLFKWDRVEMGAGGAAFLDAVGDEGLAGFEPETPSGTEARRDRPPAGSSSAITES